MIFFFSAVEFWNDVSSELQAVLDGSVEELEEAVSQAPGEEECHLIVSSPGLGLAGPQEPESLLRARKEEAEGEAAGALAGQVLIVGEAEEEMGRLGQEVTVTGQDGLQHRVQIQVEGEEEEASGGEEEEEEDQEITAAMAGVECVTIDGNPAPTDESVQRVARSRPDVTQEVV